MILSSLFDDLHFFTKNGLTIDFCVVQFNSWKAWGFPENEGNEMKETAIFIFVIGAFCAIVWFWLNLPIVTYSYESGKCVKVEPASAGSCDKLPYKYEAQWSK